MKTLMNFIIEKLSLNKSSKIELPHHLDSEILDDLHKALVEYIEGAVYDPEGFDDEKERKQCLDCWIAGKSYMAGSNKSFKDEIKYILEMINEFYGEYNFDIDMILKSDSYDEIEDYFIKKVKEYHNP